MAKRRSRGEGGIHWNEKRQRWIVTVDTGYAPSGKRRRTYGSAKTKTEAKAVLRRKLRDRDEGRVRTSDRYTVQDAVNAWLKFGLLGREPSTVENRTLLAQNHVIPDLGSRRLAELSADEVDEWLASKRSHLSTDTLRRILSILRQSIHRAQARDKVKRNVAMLCTAPPGRKGRPSKSLTLAQAEALLKAAEDSPLRAYFVVALLTGARTEELRALPWDHVDLDGDPHSDPPVPATLQVWRSVRSHGDTKTKKSRRTLELPQRCVAALTAQRGIQEVLRQKAGDRWVDTGLVFTTEVGTALDAANVRRALRRIAADAGLDPREWTPREMRHSFVSLLSEAGIPIEDISRLVGHRSTTVTELVYRKQLQPVLTKGATIMDRIFTAEATPQRHREP